MSRKLSIKLEQTSGNIDRFYAFVNQEKVIAEDGGKKPEWSGQVPDHGVTIKLRVTGVDPATFKLTIDLERTAKNQTIELQLDGGYRELESTL